MSEEGAVLGRVLVVDDDRGLLSIIKGILSKDYDVTLASSGPEALEALKSGGADLVLLDIMMPGMDGLEVCRKIKANAATAELPVIFLTGMEDEDAEEAALDAGGADFIAKPIRQRILESRVRMQMQNYMYLQFLERMLREKSTSVDRLKGEIEQLLKSIGLTASK